MKKLARAIVKMRRLILIAAVLLLIPAAVGAIATPINYDILSYLPQELDSRVGQLLLETDYHLASTNMITVEGMPTNELLAMKAEIDEVPDVLNTFWLSDVLDPAVPTEMLPADVQQFMFGKNDSSWAAPASARRRCRPWPKSRRYSGRTASSAASASS